MNLTPMKKATGCLTIAFLIICSLTSVPITALPSQGIPAPKSADVVSSARSEPVKATKGALVAHNTIIPASAVDGSAIEKPATASNDKKKHDKKTMNRCWKRLMAMAREANRVHRKKKE